MQRLKSPFSIWVGISIALQQLQKKLGVITLPKISWNANHAVKINAHPAHIVIRRDNTQVRAVIHSKLQGDRALLESL